MSLLNDPFELGKAIGFTVGIGGAAYFLARKFLPERRTGAVARLMKKTGVADEGDEKRSRWVPPPWLIAVVVGLTAGVLYVGLVVKPGFSVVDLAELRKGFDDGCRKRCASDGSDAELCKEFCTCVLVMVAKKNSTGEGLVEWFNNVRRQEPLATSQLVEAQGICVARARAAGRH
jgi:hypothetical protein